MSANSDSLPDAERQRSAMTARDFFYCVLIAVPALFAAKLLSTGIFDPFAVGFCSGLNLPIDQTHQIQFLSCGLAGLTFVGVGTLLTSRIRSISCWVFASFATLVALGLEDANGTSGFLGQSSGAIIGALIFGRKSDRRTELQERASETTCDRPKSDLSLPLNAPQSKSQDIPQSPSKNSITKTLDERLLEVVFNRSHIIDTIADYHRRGHPVPFTNNDNDKLYWGLPSFALSLMLSRTRTRRDTALESLLISGYEKRLEQPSSNVQIGNYVFVITELVALEQMQVFKQQFFQSFIDIVVDSNQLLTHVSRHRRRESQKVEESLKNSRDPELALSGLLSGESSAYNDPIFMVLATQIVAVTTGRFIPPGENEDYNFAEAVLRKISERLVAVEDS